MGKVPIVSRAEERPPPLDDFMPYFAMYVKSAWEGRGICRCINIVTLTCALLYLPATCWNSLVVFDLCWLQQGRWDCPA